MRIRVFEGGDPPAEEPIKTFYFDKNPIFKIVDNFTGGVQPELAVRQGDLATPQQHVLLFVDCASTYVDDSPGYEFVGGSHSSAGYGKGIASGGILTGAAKGLVISEPQSHLPKACKFYFYRATPSLDTACDFSLIVDDSFSAHATLALPAGDVNGDGYMDLVVSTYANADPSAVYILYGAEAPDSIADVVIQDPWGTSYFGRNIVPLGDINKDGYDDLIILNAANLPATIMYGGDPPSPTLLRLDQQGREAANCRDINQDGWDDIVIGDWGANFNNGAVYVYFGGHPMDTIADVVILHDDLPFNTSWLGRSVGAAGDFNGDGIPDIAVGAGNSHNDNLDKGYLIIFSGIAGPVAADDPVDQVLPDQDDLLCQNYPNPFNSSTAIRYTLSGASERAVTLTIHNVLGQTVRTLFAGKQRGGDHTVVWDGLDDAGEAVPSGVYFYRLTTPSETVSKKMMLVK